MSITTRDGSPFLYMQFQYKGRRYLRSTEILIEAGTKNEKKNRAAAAKAEKQFRVLLQQQEANRKLLGITEAEEHAAKQKVAIRDRMPTLKQLVDQWWERHGNLQYKEGSKTAIGMHGWMNAVLKPRILANGTSLALGQMRVDDITFDVLSQYVANRNAQGMSAVTINRETRVIRMLLERAKVVGLIEEMPHIDKLPHFKENRHNRVVTEEEEEIYAAAAGPVLRIFMRIAISTGMEPGPLAELRWEDISFVDQTGKYKDGYIHDRCTKNANRDRNLGISLKLLGLLREYNLSIGRPTEGWVFPAKNRHGHVLLNTFQRLHAALWGKGWNHGVVAKNRPLLNVDGKPIIPYFRLYDLRHTALTRFQASGMDVFELQEIAGWASIQMADRYVHRSEQQRADAFNRLGEQERQRERERNAKG